MHNDFTRPRQRGLLGTSPTGELAARAVPSARPDQSYIAWALADAAAVVLPDPVRAEVFVCLGSGDYLDSIATLLGALVAGGQSLTPAMIDITHRWLDGYDGSRDGPRLRQLLHRCDPRTQRTFS